MQSLHIVLNNFINDSRILKECKSIHSELNIKVNVYALHKKGLETEIENDFLKLKRFQLKTHSGSHKLPVQLLKYIECLRKMYKDAIELKPDIVHAHDLDALPIGVVISKRLKIPLIYDAHEFETEVQKYTNQSAIIHYALMKFEKILVKSAQSVITVSEGIADEYKLRYSIPKPDLVLNCPPKFEGQKSTLLRDYFRIPLEETVFLYQGGLGEGRGLPQVLEAFSELVKEKAILIVMGYGPMQEFVRNYANKYDNIFFKDAVPPDELVSWTSSADIGISTIENICLSYYYCLPNKLFEYLQAGLPVIVSNLPELKKVVEPNHVGWVVENDTVEGLKTIVLHLLKNGWAMEQRNIDKIMDQYTWEKQEKVLLNIYRRYLTKELSAKRTGIEFESGDPRLSSGSFTHRSGMEHLGSSIRTDNSVFFVLEIIMLNNRLKTYQEYIELAKRQGYKLCSMKAFYEDRNQLDAKHFVLRHDVDHITPATRKMYETEKKCGVKSTYYFRFCTIDLPLIQEMISDGFEIGLHYETISNYAKYHNSINMNGIDLNIVRERLKSDIAKFSDMVGYNITSCAAHGAYENSKLHCSNNVLLEDQNMEDYGIVFEAYDKALYEQYIDCHIMDGNIRLNYGFSYRDNPIDAILSGKRNILFLTHPNHWYGTLLTRIRDIIALILGRIKLSTDRKFKRIEGVQNPKY